MAHLGLFVFAGWLPAQGSSTPTPDAMEPMPGAAAQDAAESDGAEAFRLFTPHLENYGVDVGGWVSLGYHSRRGSLFNSDPHRVNAHQAWLYAERVADAPEGEFDFGFRFDVMYGTDAGDTASFGNPPNSTGGRQGWDATSSFSRGSGYGWALPQAYVEVASGDFNVKAGHFYTLIGYEVVGAPGNFFYSHAITMYNSEPFTHTGVLGSYNASDDTTIYGGWTAGWDTGFERFDDGSNFLGGVSTSVTEDVVVAYMTTIGDFGARGSDGFMQSVVVDVAVCENIGYVAQSDILHVGSTGEDTFGLNQYLVYTLTDQLAVGGRFEWWRCDAQTGYAPYGGTAVGGMTSHYAATVGVNFAAHPNVMLRPEVRYDWSPGADYDQFIFGIDAVATF